MTVWQALVGNLAVAALFISGWTHFERRYEGRLRLFRLRLFSFWMAAAVVSTMLLGVKVGSGVIIDLRASLIAIAGLFGGPYALLITGGSAIIYRLAFGGDGATAGIAAIALAMIAGLGGFHAARRQYPRRWVVLGLGVATGLANLMAMLVLPTPVGMEALVQYWIPVAVLCAGSTIAAAAVISQAGLARKERHLLRTAVAQAPDFFYIKDLASRFVAVNETVAAFHGFARPADLTGKSDFDIETADRAEKLYEAEQEIIRSLQPMIELEEVLTDRQGTERVLLTSKAPLRDSDGEVLGIVGVTRDKTEQRAIDRQLRDSRNQLAFVLTEMADGLALYDEDDRLVFCNAQYHAMFPLTQDVRVPGATLAAILRAAAERGEQGNLSAGEIDGWIEGILDNFRKGGDEEIHLYDGRWLQVRTTQKPGVGSTSVITDVTAIKRAQRELTLLTEQLRLLATTDGLTGLVNRRALDDCLDREIARTRRNLEPLTLILVDIDRFKAFNDLYGHPAGDDCLQKVAEVLRRNARRAADCVARYGGEEFCIVLADMDEDAGYLVADEMRKAVRALRLPHAGSEKDIVTISLGVATYHGSEMARSPLELLTRADEALYVAKGAGRDRVKGWVGHAAARSPAA